MPRLALRSGSARRERAAEGCGGTRGGRAWREQCRLAARGHPRWIFYVRGASAVKSTWCLSSAVSDPWRRADWEINRVEARACATTRRHCNFSRSPEKLCALLHMIDRPAEKSWVRQVLNDEDEAQLVPSTRRTVDPGSSLDRCLLQHCGAINNRLFAGCMIVLCMALLLWGRCARYKRPAQEYDACMNAAVMHSLRS